MMKNTILLFIGIFIFFNSTFAQKGFKYSELENKVLYLHTYETNPKYIKNMLKEGNFKEIEDAEALAEAYNKMVEEAMALSAYDATPYEIREFDERQLKKDKNEEAMLLKYVEDEHGNTSAMLVVTGPKYKIIAKTIINGLDISYAPDFRLMINLLNYSLNTFAELEEEGDITNSSKRTKYKQVMVDFVDSIEDKTFYVPRFTPAEYKKKYDKMNKKVREAIKSWDLCDYEILPPKEIEEIRANGDKNGFYWRSFPIYNTVKAGMVYVTTPMFSMNFLLTCDGDIPVFYWYGSVNIKGNIFENAQEKMLRKAEKYRKQLSKE